MEKILPSQCDMVLISKIYREYTNSAKKETRENENSPIKKQANELNEHFLHENEWPAGT